MLFGLGFLCGVVVTVVAAVIVLRSLESTIAEIIVGRR